MIVDDLDRCKSEYVVALLEGIQTLFADEPVAFVIAADRTWLCQSFATAYGAFDPVVGEPGRPLGYLFLEKTFQVSMSDPADDASRAQAVLGRSEPARGDAVQGCAARIAASRR